MDANGGRLTSDGDATLTYTDADGVEVETAVTLPDGFAFDQTNAIPVGPDAGVFLIPIDLAGGIDDFGKATLVLASVAEDGTASVLVVDDPTLEAFGLYRTLPRGGEFFTEGFDLQSMGDGRVAAHIDTIFNDGDGGPRLGVFDLEDGALGYTQTALGDSNGGLDGTVYGLGDGGTVSVYSNDFSTNTVFEIVQHDADGVELAKDALRVSQVEALGYRSGSSEAVAVRLDDDGELEVIVSGRIGDQRIVYDLLPEQSDAEGIVLPDFPRGRYFLGDDGNDSFVGTAGSDDFYTEGGDDFARGGAGLDTFYMGEGNDTAFGGEDLDSFSMGAGDDVAFGGAGVDDLNGGDGAVDLRGGDDVDFVSGRDGSDFLRGNHGDDQVSGGDGADDLNGGFGDDELYGRDGDDKVAGFDGTDELYGGDGADVMHGGRGDDVLFGGAGDDLLRGSDGADTLEGGAGDDLLIGGKGADVYRFDLFEEQGGSYSELDADGNPVWQTVTAAQATELGSDTIKGFVAGEDKIVLDATYLAETDEGTIERVSDLTFDDIFLSQD